MQVLPSAIFDDVHRAFSLPIQDAGVDNNFCCLDFEAFNPAAVVLYCVDVLNQSRGVLYICRAGFQSDN